MAQFVLEGLYRVKFKTFIWQAETKCLIKNYLNTSLLHRLIYSLYQ